MSFCFLDLLFLNYYFLFNREREKEKGAGGSNSIFRDLMASLTIDMVRGQWAF